MRCTQAVERGLLNNALYKLFAIHKRIVLLPKLLLPILLMFSVLHQTDAKEELNVPTTELGHVEEFNDPSMFGSNDNNMVDSARGTNTLNSRFIINDNLYKTQYEGVANSKRNHREKRLGFPYITFRKNRNSHRWQNIKNLDSISESPFETTAHRRLRFHRSATSKPTKFDKETSGLMVEKLERPYIANQFKTRKLSGRNSKGIPPKRSKKPKSQKVKLKSNHQNDEKEVKFIASNKKKITSGKVVSENNLSNGEEVKKRKLKPNLMPHSENRMQKSNKQIYLINKKEYLKNRGVKNTKLKKLIGPRAKPTPSRIVSTPTIKNKVSISNKPTKRKIKLNKLDLVDKYKKDLKSKKVRSKIKFKHDQESKIVLPSNRRNGKLKKHDSSQDYELPKRLYEQMYKQVPLILQQMEVRDVSSHKSKPQPISHQMVQPKIKAAFEKLSQAVSAQLKQPISIPDVGQLIKKNMSSCQCNIVGKCRTHDQIQNPDVDLGDMNECRCQSFFGTATNSEEERKMECAENNEATKKMTHSHRTLADSSNIENDVTDGNQNIFTTSTLKQISAITKPNSNGNNKLCNPLEEIAAFPCKKQSQVSGNREGGDIFRSRSQEGSFSSHDPKLSISRCPTCNKTIHSNHACDESKYDTMSNHQKNLCDLLTSGLESYLPKDMATTIHFPGLEAEPPRTKQKYKYLINLMKYKDKTFSSDFETTRATSAIESYTCPDMSPISELEKESEDLDDIRIQQSLSRSKCLGDKKVETKLLTTAATTDTTKDINTTQKKKETKMSNTKFTELTSNVIEKDAEDINETECENECDNTEADKRITTKNIPTIEKESEDLDEIRFYQSLNNKFLNTNEVECIPSSSLETTTCARETLFTARQVPPADILDKITESSADMITAESSNNKSTSACKDNKKKLPEKYSDVDMSKKFQETCEMQCNPLALNSSIQHLKMCEKGHHPTHIDDSALAIEDIYPPKVNMFHLEAELYNDSTFLFDPMSTVKPSIHCFDKEKPKTYSKTDYESNHNNKSEFCNCSFPGKTDGNESKHTNVVSYENDTSKDVQNSLKKGTKNVTILPARRTTKTLANLVTRPSHQHLKAVGKLIDLDAEKRSMNNSINMQTSTVVTTTKRGKFADNWKKIFGGHAHDATHTSIRNNINDINETVSTSNIGDDLNIKNAQNTPNINNGNITPKSSTIDTIGDNGMNANANDIMNKNIDNAVNSIDINNTDSDIESCDTNFNKEDIAITENKHGMLQNVVVDKPNSNFSDNPNSNIVTEEKNTASKTLTENPGKEFSRLYYCELDTGISNSNMNSQEVGKIKNFQSHSNDGVEKNVKHNISNTGGSSGSKLKGKVNKTPVGHHGNIFVSENAKNADVEAPFQSSDKVGNLDKVNNPHTFEENSNENTDITTSAFRNGSSINTIYTNASNIALDLGIKNSTTLYKPARKHFKITTLNNTTPTTTIFLNFGYDSVGHKTENPDGHCFFDLEKQHFLEVLTSDIPTVFTNEFPVETPADTIVVAMQYNDTTGSTSTISNFNALTSAMDQVDFDNVAVTAIMENEQFDFDNFIAHELTNINRTASKSSLNKDNMDQAMFDLGEDVVGDVDNDSEDMRNNTEPSINYADLKTLIDGKPKKVSNSKENKQKKLKNIENMKCETTIADIKGDDKIGNAQYIDTNETQSLSNFQINAGVPNFENFTSDMVYENHHNSNKKDKSKKLHINIEKLKISNLTETVGGHGNDKFNLKKVHLNFYDPSRAKVLGIELKNDSVSSGNNFSNVCLSDGSSTTNHNFSAFLPNENNLSEGDSLLHEVSDPADMRLHSSYIVEMVTEHPNFQINGLNITCKPLLSKDGKFNLNISDTGSNHSSIQRNAGWLDKFRLGKEVPRVTRPYLANAALVDYTTIDDENDEDMTDNADVFISEATVSHVKPGIHTSISGFEDELKDYTSNFNDDSESGHLAKEKLCDPMLENEPRPKEVVNYFKITSILPIKDPSEILDASSSETHRELSDLLAEEDDNELKIGSHYNLIDNPIFTSRRNDGKQHNVKILNWHKNSDQAIRSRSDGRLRNAISSKQVGSTKNTESLVEGNKEKIHSVKILNAKNDKANNSVKMSAKKLFPHVDNEGNNEVKDNNESVTNDESPETSEDEDEENNEDSEEMDQNQKGQVIPSSSLDVEDEKENFPEIKDEALAERLPNNCLVFITTDKVLDDIKNQYTNVQNMILGKVSNNGSFVLNATNENLNDDDDTQDDNNDSDENNDIEIEENNLRKGNIHKIKNKGNKATLHKLKVTPHSKQNQDIIEDITEEQSVKPFGDTAGPDEDHVQNCAWGENNSSNILEKNKTCSVYLNYKYNKLKDLEHSKQNQTGSKIEIINIKPIGKAESIQYTVNKPIENYEHQIDSVKYDNLHAVPGKFKNYTKSENLNSNITETDQKTYKGKPNGTSKAYLKFEGKKLKEKFWDLHGQVMGKWRRPGEPGQSNVVLNQGEQKNGEGQKGDIFNIEDSLNINPTSAMNENNMGLSQIATNAPQTIVLGHEEQVGGEEGLNATKDTALIQDEITGHLLGNVIVPSTDNTTKSTCTCPQITTTLNTTTSTTPTSSSTITTTISTIQESTPSTILPEEVIPAVLQEIISDITDAENIDHVDYELSTTPTFSGSPAETIVDKNLINHGLATIKLPPLDISDTNKMLNGSVLNVTCFIYMTSPGYTDSTESNLNVYSNLNELSYFNHNEITPSSFSGNYTTPNSDKEINTDKLMGGPEAEFNPLYFEPPLFQDLNSVITIGVPMYPQDNTKDDISENIVVLGGKLNEMNKPNYIMQEKLNNLLHNGQIFDDNDGTTETSEEIEEIEPYVQILANKAVIGTDSGIDGRFHNIEPKNFKDTSRESNKGIVPNIITDTQNLVKSSTLKNLKVTDRNAQLIEFSISIKAQISTTMKPTHAMEAGPFAELNSERYDEVESMDGDVDRIKDLNLNANNKCNPNEVLSVCVPPALLDIINSKNNPGNQFGVNVNLPPNDLKTFKLNNNQSRENLENISNVLSGKPPNTNRLGNFNIINQNEHNVEYNDLQNKKAFSNFENVETTLPSTNYVPNMGTDILPLTSNPSPVITEAMDGIGSKDNYNGNSFPEKASYDNKKITTESSTNMQQIINTGFEGSGKLNEKIDQILTDSDAKSKNFSTNAEQYLKTYGSDDNFDDAVQNYGIDDSPSTVSFKELVNKTIIDAVNKVCNQEMQGFDKGIIEEDNEAEESVVDEGKNQTEGPHKECQNENRFIINVTLLSNCSKPQELLMPLNLTIGKNQSIPKGSVSQINDYESKYTLTGAESSKPIINASTPRENGTVSKSGIIFKPDIVSKPKIKLPIQKLIEQNFDESTGGQRPNFKNGKISFEFPNKENPMINNSILSGIKSQRVQNFNKPKIFGTQKNQNFLQSNELQSNNAILSKNNPRFMKTFPKTHNAQVCNTSCYAVNGSNNLHFNRTTNKPLLLNNFNRFNKFKELKHKIMSPPLLFQDRDTNYDATPNTSKQDDFKHSLTLFSNSALADKSRGTLKKTKLPIIYDVQKKPSLPDGAILNNDDFNHKKTVINSTMKQGKNSKNSERTKIFSMNKINFPDENKIRKIEPNYNRINLRSFMNKIKSSVAVDDITRNGNTRDVIQTSSKESPSSTSQKFNNEDVNLPTLDYSKDPKSFENIQKVEFDKYVTKPKLNQFLPEGDDARTTEQEKQKQGPKINRINLHKNKSQPTFFSTNFRLSTYSNPTKIDGNDIQCLKIDHNKGNSKSLIHDTILAEIDAERLHRYKYKVQDEKLTTRSNIELLPNTLDENFLRVRYPLNLANFVNGAVYTCDPRIRKVPSPNSTGNTASDASNKIEMEIKHLVTPGKKNRKYGKIVNEKPKFFFSFKERPVCVQKPMTNIHKSHNIAASTTTSSIIPINLLLPFNVCLDNVSTLATSSSATPKSSPILKLDKNLNMINKTSDSGGDSDQSKLWDTKLSPQELRRYQAKNMMKYMDFTMSPCQDFYQYACGNWHKYHPIPADHGGFDTFEMLRENLDLHLRRLLEDDTDNSAYEVTNNTREEEDKISLELYNFAPNQTVPSPYFEEVLNSVRTEFVDPIRKAKNLYKSCMKEQLIDKRGEKPLLHLLTELRSWPILESSWDASSFDLIWLLGQLRLYNNDLLISEWIGPDIKNSDEYVIQIDQTSLGLPSREYFLSDTSREYIEAYHQFLLDIVYILGAPEDQAVDDVKDIIDFEIKLAMITADPEDRRNLTSIYARLTLGELQVFLPQFDWIRYFEMVAEKEMSISTPIVCYCMSYLQDLVNLVSNSRVRTLANYLLWRFVRHRVNNLDERFQNAKQKFYHLLFGREASPPRWQFCVAQVNSNLGMALGNLFVNAHFDEKSKNDTILMTRQLENAFKNILMLSDWLDDSTRSIAIAKVDAMRLRIGYPDMILNKQLLMERYKDIKVHPDYYFENSLSILRHLTRNEHQKIGKMVDKNMWNTAPAVVNAYYSRNKNQIMFPAGILQPPFYHQHFPKALNYGGIGVVIGHEITHGFDDKGRLFDKDGNLNTWWSDEATEKFRDKAKCIVDQYNSFVVPEVNAPLDGMTTQGENIADNGGIKQSYRAYQDWLKTHNDDALPGFNISNKQMFFLNFAQVWCGSSRPEAAKNRLKTAVHSPGRFRVIGTLRNSWDFADAYQCPAGSPMNPITKCMVW